MKKVRSGILQHIVSRLGDAIFPAVCECCGRSLVDGEEILCLHCLHDLPLTNYHKDSFNELHKRLAAPKVPIEHAASMFHYIKDSRFALLVQRAKYNNRPIIIRHLARIFAKELYKDHFFDDINLILPIPLHWRKKLKRGFNQSEEIAKSISEISGIKYGDNLKARPHSTQTRKNAIERAANMEGTIYVCNSDELAGLHVLIVDDVMTTGATILTAAKAILNASPSTRISVLTLASSKQI